MVPRKRVRFSECVSTFGDDNQSRYTSSNSKASASGELRLPLHTLKLLMQKCQVRLTRCDHVTTAQKVWKKQRKSVESLYSLKTEVADLEEKENWEEDDIDANLLVPQIKIEEEEDERLMKPSFFQLSKFMFNTKPCHVKLSRCDAQDQEDIKPEVKLKQEGPAFLALQNCQVVLFRCDIAASKIEGKAVSRRVVGRKKKIRKSEPVPCYLCEKLVASSYINIHLTKHTGERPFKCPVCPDKAYLFQSELKIHNVRKHGQVGVATSGETTCSKKRSQPNHTKRPSGYHHLSIKREQVPRAPVQKKSPSSDNKSKRNHTCDICESSFTRKRGLIYHVSFEAFKNNSDLEYLDLKNAFNFF